MLFKERECLRRVENKRKEHFDNFSSDINIDVPNVEEDDRIISDEEVAGERADGEGPGREDNFPNLENLTKDDNLSHQHTKPTQEIKSTNTNLLVVVGIVVERLKSTLESELNNPLQTVNVGNETISETSDASRNFRLRTIFHATKDINKHGAMVGQKSSIDGMRKNPQNDDIQTKKAHNPFPNSELKIGPKNQ